MDRSNSPTQEASTSTQSPYFLQSVEEINNHLRELVGKLRRGQVNLAPSSCQKSQEEEQADTQAEAKRRYRARLVSRGPATQTPSSSQSPDGTLDD